MKSSDDKHDNAVPQGGGFWMPDMTKWRSEVSDFFSKARREIRLIRESLAGEPRVRDSSLLEPPDVVRDSGRGGEIPPAPASESCLHADTNALKSLRQRLTQQLDHCIATLIHERTDELGGKEQG